MKKILILSLILFFGSQCLASEITGKIRTNGGDNHEQEEESLIDGPEVEVESQSVEGNQYIPNREQVSVLRSKEGDEAVSEVRILGIERYPNGCLLRNELDMIYVVSGMTKKHVLNLEELMKYFGKTIFDVGDSVLGQYENKSFGEGDLIRKIGDEKVFVINNGKKRHIHSLDELRREYWGRIINNVKEKDFTEYSSMK